MKNKYKFNAIQVKLYQSHFIRVIADKEKTFKVLIFTNFLIIIIICWEIYNILSLIKRSIEFYLPTPGCFRQKIKSGWCFAMRVKLWTSSFKLRNCLRSGNEKKTKNRLQNSFIEYFGKDHQYFINSFRLWTLF